MTIDAPAKPHSERVVQPSYQRYDPSRLVGVMAMDAYVDLEQRTNERFEYLEGNVIAMPGGSPEHNRIIANLNWAFISATSSEEIDADVYSSDQKIAVGDTLYRYADSSVVCGKAQFDPRDALQNPTVLLEVLSPSTESDDRTDKFREYQRIESLRHSILIDQFRPYVTHYEKLEQGIWGVVGEHVTLDDSLRMTLDAKTILVPLSAIYRRVLSAESP